MSKTTTAAATQLGQNIEATEDGADLVLRVRNWLTADNGRTAKGFRRIASTGGNKLHQGISIGINLYSKQG